MGGGFKVSVELLLMARWEQSLPRHLPALLGLDFTEFITKNSTFLNCKLAGMRTGKAFRLSNTSNQSSPLLLDNFLLSLPFQFFILCDILKETHLFLF